MPYQTETERRDDTLILAVAQRIHRNEHPRSSWIKYPNYAQSEAQARYLQLARAIVIQVRAHDAQ